MAHRAKAHDAPAWHDSADEGVPRYDPHAYSDSAGGLGGDPVTSLLHPDDARERFTYPDSDERAWRGKAEVEEWRSSQIERRSSVAASTMSRRSSTRGTGSQDTLGGLTEADLARMSDAEIGASPCSH